MVAGSDCGRRRARGRVAHRSAALRLLADRSGLTAELSRASRRRGFAPVHDRGRVLADTAVLIADWGPKPFSHYRCRPEPDLSGLPGWTA